PIATESSMVANRDLPINKPEKLAVSRSEEASIPLFVASKVNRLTPSYLTLLASLLIFSLGIAMLIRKDSSENSSETPQESLPAESSLSNPASSSSTEVALAGVPAVNPLAASEALRWYQKDARGSSGLNKIASLREKSYASHRITGSAIGQE